MLDKFIEGCVSGDEADRSKPQPDIFLACIEKFKLAPASTIVIGDTRWDVEAAAKVGLRTIAVTCGGFDAAGYLVLCHRIVFGNGCRDVRAGFSSELSGQPSTL